jgi:Formyl transferase
MSEASGEGRLRSVLICHVDSTLNRGAIARWLASFTDLAGVVLIDEPKSYGLRRIEREIKRIGLARFLDVVAFRLYYLLFLARADRRWLDERLRAICARYPDVPASTEILTTADPNGADVKAFLERIRPDVMVARCKRILKAAIFEIPRRGTFVLHPGVCPEYRNAHGAFWALAQRDLSNVGLTLLKIDAGVDTGPVYGYFSCDYDEVAESHIVVMTRLALDNLDALRERLLAACAGTATPLDTAGRRSAVWGQPWLTAYLKWKRAARNHARAGA